MSASTRYDELLDRVKALVVAERKSKAEADKRAALPPGSSRARVTTANARWATAAESRDRHIELVRAEVERLGLAVRP